VNWPKKAVTRVSPKGSTLETAQKYSGVRERAAQSKVRYRTGQILATAAEHLCYQLKTPVTRKGGRIGCPAPSTARIRRSALPQTSDT